MCRPVCSLVSLFGAWLIVASLGCGSNPMGEGHSAATPDVADLAAQPTSPESSLSDSDLDQLRTELDQVIAGVLHGRQLNATDHAAWQVLHGILAFGRDFPLYVGNPAQPTPALDYLLQGGTLKGWEWQAGETLPDGRTGLRAVMEPGTKSGQGHMDQWFAYMSQAGLAPDQTIRAAGREFKISDVVQQSQLDVARNVDREYSWTVTGLTSYLPTNTSWQASDGKSWTIEQLLESEVKQDLSASACGGTHRMVSLIMALRQHKAQQGTVTGVWHDIDEKVQECLNLTKSYQQANGAFSSNYFERPGVSADLAQMLGSTGHSFEFVALAIPEDQVRAVWVARAARYLSGLLQKTMDRELECGALYHAVHGLVIYRQRLGFPLPNSTPSQVDPSQVGPSQVGPSQVGPSQVDSSQVDSSQVDSSQVDSSQVDSPQATLPQSRRSADRLAT